MEGAPACVNPFHGPWVAGARCSPHVAEMTGKEKEREERLAAALRENLRRRKAQSREIGTTGKDGNQEEPNS